MGSSGKPRRTRTDKRARKREPLFKEHGGDVDLLAGWAGLLMETLLAWGVTDLVASPGRASLPYYLAAARDPRWRVHHVLDERAAGFFALGQARVTGRPSVVLCTGGSAGTHFYPAVVEATMSHLPLIVLTGDRPAHDKDCGLHQSIDQVRLFGHYPRKFIDLGLPDASVDGLGFMQRSLSQAVLASLWPTPGAVHLNVRLRVSRPPAWRRAPELAREMTAAGPPAVHRSLPMPDPKVVAAVAREVAAVERGLIVAGPGWLDQGAARQAVAELAQLTGFPLLAEATSQWRFGAPANACAGFELLCMSQRFRERQVPELILQLGAVPVSAGWGAYQFLHAAARRVVVARHGWPDPHPSGTALVLTDPGLFAAAVAHELKQLGERRRSTRRSSWLRRFQAADSAVWRIVDADLASTPYPNEGAAVRETVASLPRDGLLALGNSLPVRHIDIFCPATLPPVPVLSQRGASGIEGTIAGAVGAAVASRRPVTLLVGDIGFLHDLDGLTAARALDTPLVVVVLHNDGGRIAELSAAGVASGLAGAHTVMQHGILDLAPAARLFGHAFARPETRDALAHALAQAHVRPGCTVIQVDVPPHAAAEQYGRLQALVGRAVRALPG